MSQNEAFAAAAHLHVLLRRKTGRVTDTEWMVSNFEYAQAIVRYARDKASEDGHDDLLPLADRLEALVIPVRKPAVPSVPLLTVIEGRLKAPASAADLDTRYIGRLR